MHKFSVLCLLLVICSSYQDGTDMYLDRDGYGNCPPIYTNSYKHENFHHLSSYSSKAEKGALLIKFKVQARNEAHVLLSPSPSLSENVYEVVLRNGFSEIRRSRRKDDTGASFTKDILSSTEPRGFWVKISANGVIDVGKDGEDKSFLFWKDFDPLNVRYISFFTGRGTSGKWFYNCDEELDRHLTITQRLRLQLLEHYDRDAIPLADSDTSIPISIGLITDLIQLDAKNSKITVRGTLNMNWFDYKMQWDPMEYRNISSLNFFNNELWSPEFVLYNAVGNGDIPLDQSKMVLSAFGDVHWNPKTKLEARCYLNLSYWPWDTQTCTVQLGFGSQQDALNIILMENGTKLTQMQKTASEWYVAEMVSGTTKVWNPGFQVSGGDVEDGQVDQDVLTFTFTLRRISTVYCYVFMLPLIAAIVMTLSSFWMSPFGHEKLSINCLVLLILCAMLITIQSELPAPADHTPYLLRSYSHVMLVVGITTAVAVVVINISRSLHSGPPSTYVCSVLSSRLVSFVLCFPERIVSVDNNLYVNPLEEDSRSYIQSSRTSLVTIKDIDAKQYWNLLALSLDRITFIVTSVAMAILLMP